MKLGEKFCFEQRLVVISTLTDVVTLRLQEQSVVVKEDFSHKDDSRVYIELSENWMQECTLLSSSNNHPSKVN
jgi:hypothetical protein